MKILHRILKHVKIDVRKDILTVNLRGFPKAGGLVGKLKDALESDFDCKFTWVP